ncbi:alpha/beta fold hydrolase [Flavobacterium artemisiae]|uniref:Alpha/beta fold hydrolase n=1 Tax=Flavobacterium artemisiae TaxID=2126556 RepID=A0ABW4HLI1_9FLAO
MKKTILTLLTAVFSFSTFASCSNNEEVLVTKPQTYVFVHGAWQAPYVWDEVKNDLIKKGNQVVVVELPAHGADQTPAYTVSIESYRDKVISEINKVEGKVILVGHSMGGMVVTAVAESIPTKISKLVYIGAFVPESGQNLAELSMKDPNSKLGPFLSQSADQLYLNVDVKELTNLFIADGNAAAKQKVTENYRPEPAIPFGSKVNWTKEHFGSVEKIYIKTLQDVVISPKFQEQMIASAAIKTVYSVNASHSPFLSQPKAVSDLLLKIGN